MTLHRKIGGIHWFSIGRLRISVCMKSKTVFEPSQPANAPTARPTVADLNRLSAEPQHLILPNVSAWTWPEGVAHVMNREEA